MSEILLQLAPEWMDFHRAQTQRRSIAMDASAMRLASSLTHSERHLGIIFGVYPDMGSVLKRNAHVISRITDCHRELLGDDVIRRLESIAKLGSDPTSASAFGDLRVVAQTTLGIDEARAREIINGCL